MKTITLLTSNGEISANIVDFKGAMMVVNFNINGIEKKGSVLIEKQLVQVSAGVFAKIKETKKELLDIYNSFFITSYSDPFLNVHITGEDMIRIKSRINTLTGEFSESNEIIWSR